MPALFLSGVHLHQFCPVWRLDIQSRLSWQRAEQRIQHQWPVHFLNFSFAGQVDVGIQHNISLFCVVIQGKRSHCESHPKPCHPKENNKRSRKENELSDLSNCMSNGGVRSTARAGRDRNLAKEARDVIPPVKCCSCNGYQWQECADEANVEGDSARESPIVPEYPDLFQCQIFTYSVLKVVNRRFGLLSRSYAFLDRFSQIYDCFVEAQAILILLFVPVVPRHADFSQKYFGVIQCALLVDAPISRISRLNVLRIVLKKSSVGVKDVIYFNVEIRESQLPNNCANSKARVLGFFPLVGKGYPSDVRAGYCHKAGKLGRILERMKDSDALYIEATNEALSQILCSLKALAGATAALEGREVATFDIVAAPLGNMARIPAREVLRILAEKPCPKCSEVCRHLHPPIFDPVSLS